MTTEPTTPAEWRNQYDTDHAIDPDDAMPNTGLTLTDLAWHARRHQARTRQLEGLARAATEARAEIDEWERQQPAPIRERLAWHATTLEAHAARIYDLSGGNTNHVDLPGGTRVQRRNGSLSVRVDDADAAAAWLREHCPDALTIKTTTAIAKTKVAERFAAKATEAKEPGDWPAIDATTGEIVPGLTLERGTPSFTIKPASKADDATPVTDAELAADPAPPATDDGSEQ